MVHGRCTFYDLCCDSQIPPSLGSRQISSLRAEITNLKSAYEKAGNEIEELRLSEERALRHNEELSRDHQREIRKLKSELQQMSEKAKDAAVG